MPPSELNTARMHGLIGAMRGGDAGAADRLVLEAVARLRGRAEQLMRKNPILARWTEAADLLQESLYRFHRSLQDERVLPTSMTDFHKLAGERMRLAMIDLARKIRGPHGISQNTESYPTLLAASGVGRAEAEQLVASADDSLEDWAALHEAVPTLSERQQAVFRMRYYNEWDDETIAQALKIEPRSVSRIYRRACETLGKRLGHAGGVSCDDALDDEPGKRK